MSVTTTSSVLQANLAALGPHNADVARQILGTSFGADVIFEPSEEDALSATYQGRRLASARRPVAEAKRLLESVDLVEHAVFVVNGFGLGHHVKALSERVKKTGLVVVLEPDVALLRAVLERMDHSTWLKNVNLALIIDPDDAGVLGRKLDRHEAILALGIEFIDHPASRARLGEDAVRFSALFRDHVTSAKTTLMTSLIRSIDTINNFLLNIDHYAAGAPLADLRDATTGHPGIVVSAGPSLSRNLKVLARPECRARCVIIATQTTLKPLLAAGIKPHFVTALDYHEISSRFYEDLDPDVLADVTLIAEPKAHPVILDSYPGPIRCCAASFLDQVLGELRRDMGELPAGSTVAHLSLYLAKFLGCDPLVMVGQDLGFPDALYYAPGTAIHDVWANELNPFNTIEMMEWQRIVRHRQHLQKTTDVDGKSIYTDAQMLTYLRQFERDFARLAEEGVEVIDATEGGVPKQHTRSMPLDEVLKTYATSPLPRWPLPSTTLDADRLDRTRARVKKVRQSVASLREVARKTSPLLTRMLADQDDPAKMARHFDRIDENRRLVEQKSEAFGLINHLNQMGLFKRMKADRRLTVQDDLTPLQRQQAELERDRENVDWIADAGRELIDMLAQAERVLAGECVEARHRVKPQAAQVEADGAVLVTPRVAALIAFDPERQKKESLKATIKRVGRSTTIQKIIVITPRGGDVESMLAGKPFGVEVEIEHCDGSPFGAEQEAIDVARRFAESCWRGGIGGTSVFDEILCPGVMLPVMEKHRLTAALIVGPDWPLVQVTEPGGCDDVVRRHLEMPHKQDLVFTQAPPGVCGCVVSATLMTQLAERNRLSTIGSLLVYQPQAPQPDPIARDANVQIDHRVRQPLVRAIGRDIADCDGERPIVDSLGELEQADQRRFAEHPQHVILELTPKRTSCGVFRRSLCGDDTINDIDRPSLDLAQAQGIVEALGAVEDVVLTLGGFGDPLLHPHCMEVIRHAKNAGIPAVHLRSELLADQSTMEQLLDSGVDVISVDLHADRAATYETMMGVDRFRDVLLNLEFLGQQRRRLTDHPPAHALAVPWIVPRLQRRAETHEDLESFFERWQYGMGTAVIEGPPPFESTPAYHVDTLIPTGPPVRYVRHQLLRRMTILSDGSVPRSELDVTGATSVGSIADEPIDALWKRIHNERKERFDIGVEDDPEMRLLLP